jgi:hypothetical protein
MTQFTCKGVKQINNRISLNMTFTFTIRISQHFLSAQERTTFDAKENFLFRSNVQWIHLGLSCYGLFGTKADESII